MLEGISVHSKLCSPNLFEYTLPKHVCLIYDWHMPELKARVFVSCGQRKDSREVDVATAIQEALEGMGFEPYVAFREQTLQGLKENIFLQLSSSEYFLFIDFAREQLVGGLEHRGSLFSHQELAIASYLGLEVIAFQQRGVKPLDGMMGAMQLNAITFDEPKTLPKMVREQVKKVDWHPYWKNILEINRTNGEFQDAYIVGTPNRRLARFFHLAVKNRNIRKIALNCTAYLESMKKLPDNVSVPIRTVELKWAGYMLPTVPIMPQSHRDVDAFFVLHDEPNILRFNCFSDSDYYLPPVLGYSKYLLNYVVISEDFPIARIVVEATIGNSIDDISLVQK